MGEESFLHDPLEDLKQSALSQDRLRPLPGRRRRPPAALPRRAVLPGSRRRRPRPQLRARLRGILSRGGRLVQHEVIGEPKSESHADA